MTFAQRAVLLKEMSKVLRDNRDELLDLSARNTGTTKPDGSFDVDGGSGTLAYYFALGKGLGDRTFLAEGDGVQLAKTEGFYGRHILVPRHGVAVHINAFNFPDLGLRREGRLRAARRHAGDHQARHLDGDGDRAGDRADRRGRLPPRRAPCSSSSARPATCSTGSAPTTSSPSPARRTPPAASARGPTSSPPTRG